MNRFCIAILMLYSILTCMCAAFSLFCTNQQNAQHPFAQNLVNYFNHLYINIHSIYMPVVVVWCGCVLPPAHWLHKMNFAYITRCIGSCIFLSCISSALYIAHNKPKPMCYWGIAGCCTLASYFIYINLCRLQNYSLHSKLNNLFFIYSRWSSVYPIVVRLFNTLYCSVTDFISISV